MAIPDELKLLKTALMEIVTPYTPREVFEVPPTAAPNTAQLPAFVLFYDQSPLDNSAYSVERRDTRYILQLLIAPVGQGKLSDNYRRAIAMLEPTLDALWAHIKLYNTGTNGVMWAKPKHGAPRALREHWSGIVYFGVEFQVQVQTWRSITLGT